MKGRMAHTIFARAGRALLLWTLSLLSAALAAGPLYAQQYGRAMTTLQYDAAHTGWNRDEVVLNVDNVNPATFGKKWTAPVNGQIYGAPLYVSGVVIDGAPRNAVYVATENNFIHALDAESGAPLWPPYFLGTPGLQSLLFKDCGSIKPNIGITSTPVIDLETGTLYAVGLTREGSNQIFKMAAVDIATGRSRPGWPVAIDPPAKPPLDTRISENRGALLLANGVVYVPFGGYAGDCGPYYGWVVGVDKSDPTTPQLYYYTPRADGGHGGGIWAAGGLAGDAAGNIYAVTGNSIGASSVDYSNGVLRLAPDLSFTGDAEDFFMPSNWVNLNDTDDDLGSSALLLLPSQEGSTTPNMAFVAGKRGVGHLLNRDDLGGVAQGDGVYGEGVYSARLFDGVASTAAYYEDTVAGPMMFLAGVGTQPDCGKPKESSSVVALALDLDAEGNSSYHVAWCTPALGFAAAPFITSAPEQAGIVWVLDMLGVLYAFNAATGDTLYDSSSVPGDAMESTQNFLHFTVIDGKVFIGTAENHVVTYGLR